MKNILEFGDEEMARPRKYDSPEHAKEQKIKNISDYNEKTYDRLTVRMQKGAKEQLVAYMQSKIKRLQELEEKDYLSDLEEHEKRHLEALYSVSTRGTPSVNDLICNLLRKETGIDF